MTFREIRFNNLCMLSFRVNISVLIILEFEQCGVVFFSLILFEIIII